MALFISKEGAREKINVKNPEVPHNFPSPVPAQNPNVKMKSGIKFIVKGGA